MRCRGRQSTLPNCFTLKPATHTGTNCGRHISDYIIVQLFPSPPPPSNHDCPQSSPVLFSSLNPLFFITRTTTKTVPCRFTRCSYDTSAFSPLTRHRTGGICSYRGIQQFTSRAPFFHCGCISTSSNDTNSCTLIECATSVTGRRAGAPSEEWFTVV